MKRFLTIVEVEVVAGDFIGVCLSDDTVLLISLDAILLLDPPRYLLLKDEDDQPST